MSTTAKRPLELGNASADSSESMGSGNSVDDSGHYDSGSDEPRRKGGKPGRKPLDDEAKNKRTAQNRAAQRAFRERKERKMKELEDKVSNLEQINQESAVEAEFLRSQLMTLMRELKKYRPEDAKDKQVLSQLSKSDPSSGSTKDVEKSMNGKTDFTFAFPWKDKNTPGEQFPSPGSSSSASGSNSFSKRKVSEISPNTFDSVPDSGTNNESSFNNNNNNNNNTPSSTTTTSGWMDNVFYSDDAQKLPPFPNTSVKTPVALSANDPLGQDSVLFSNNFNFEDEFEEQVSRFCSRMNQACGTKQFPIPKQTPKETPMALSNTWDTHEALASPNANDDGSNINNNVKSRHNSNDNDNDYDNGKSKDSSEIEGDKNSVPSLSDSISSSSMSNDKITNVLNNDSINNFIIGNKAEITKGEQPVSQSTQQNNDLFPFLDTSLAFPNENDQNLVFRDSQDSNLFAEFLDETTETNDNSNFEASLINEEPKQEKTPSADEDDDDDANDVVPARDGKLLKCSEVWDRITSHPKYTSIDIDGLCMELMAKAKCSEKGVVLQAEHVQKALSNQAAFGKH